MTAAIALLSAFAVGASDFLGSQATRRSRAELVPFLTHVASLIVMFLGVWFLSAPNVTSGDLWWGGSGGISGGLGIYLLFRSMADGQISVVAPIAAVAGSLTTVAFGVLGGDRPNTVNTVGIVFAIVAGTVISSVASSKDHDEALPGAKLGTTTPLRAVGEATTAGVLFGWFFVSLSHTSSDAGLWPLVVARVVSVILLGALAYLTKPGVPLVRRMWAPKPVIRLAMGSGVLEMIASALLLIALRRGALSTVGVLASLYPVSTVLLAAVLLQERLAKVQWFAVILALVAVPLTGW